jgi:hypothetical protein
LLNSTNSINKKWLEFYPEFSSTFKIRKNLTESEFSQISKLRIDFDELFPFSANLQSLTKNPEFVLSNFTDLFSTISSYYTKSEIYLDSLAEKIDVFVTILSNNNNIILKGETSSLNFMLSQSISEEEVLAFQNEFVEINQYFKSFMNYVMKKVKESFTTFTDKKLNLQNLISQLNKHVDKIKNQKQALLNSLLLQ